MIVFSTFIHQAEYKLTLPQSRFQPAHSSMVHTGGIHKIRLLYFLFTSNITHNPLFEILNSMRLQPSISHSALHTRECPVSTVDPPVLQRASSPQSLLDDCSSDRVLSGGRGWSLELRPEKHSLPLRPGSLIT